MKNKKILSLLSLTVLFACSNNKQNDNAAEKQNMLSTIDSLEKKMFNPQNMELDKNLAATGIAAYQDYVLKFPDDSLSAEYLFRSSDLSRALGDNRKSLDFLGQVCNKYPNYKKIPECLFLQGYYCQEFFGDTVQAKGFYDQLISKYPNHAFVDDAKALMQMFGKTEQDIINDFEKSRKSEDPSSGGKQAAAKKI